MTLADAILGYGTGWLLGALAIWAVVAVALFWERRKKNRAGKPEGEA